MVVKQLRKLIFMICVGLTLLAALVLATITVASEWRLQVDSIPAEFTAKILTDTVRIEHGRHIARTRGCFGCHGRRLEGRVFTEWPWVKRAVAPPLAEYARSHSVGELEAVIRHGIDPDGRALWSMPSYNWVRLSDADLIALIAFLRSQPAVQSDLPSPDLGWSARWQLITGNAEHMADWAKRVPELQYQDHPDPLIRRGEYLAMTTCIECHGFDLRGDNLSEGGAPDLAILAAYSDDDFRHLMKTGTALGGRDNLPLMSMIARDRFAYLTDQELDDLLVFLRTLPLQTVE